MGRGKRPAHPQCRFLALSGRGSIGAAAAATAGGRPAIVRWTVLEEEGVVAERMTLGVTRIGLAKNLARPLHVVMNLGDHRLVLGGILRESRKLARLVVKTLDSKSKIQ